MMENKLKFNLLLTLQKMVLRKVVILSWNQMLSTKENPLNTEVEDKVSKLQLPRELTKQAIDLVGPIGSEIRRWKFFHFPEYPFHLPLDLSTLCWTSEGQIDDKKTAERLVSSDIHVITRYRFACLYCLEDSLPVIWEKLSRKDRRHYYSYRFGMEDKFDALLYCWPHILSSQLSRMDHLWSENNSSLTSFNQWAFEYSATSATKVAAQYFFEKLTLAEREASLMECAHAVFDDFNSIHWSFDVSSYLLSLMTSTVQREMIEEYPTAIVLTFLLCRAQDLYMENASLVWTYFPPSKYCQLLWEMVRIFYSKPAKYFPRIFREFFILSPPELKKCFVNEFESFLPARDFLSFFFKYAHSESIEVIFENIDSADKLKLLIHRKILRLFYNSVLDNKGNMVELCLQQATLSEKDKTKWKEEFIFYVIRLSKGQIKRKDPKWKWLFDL